MVFGALGSRASNVYRVWVEFSVFRIYGLGHLGPSILRAGKKPSGLGDGC